MHPVFFYLGDVSLKISHKTPKPQNTFCWKSAKGNDVAIYKRLHLCEISSQVEETNFV